MKKLLFAASFILMSVIASALQIVMPAEANPMEKKAAYELAMHLRMAGGGQFPVVKESAEVKSPAIYVGKTSFSIKNNVTTSVPQGWIIKNVGKDMVISGGDRQGIFFGVCEFLDRLGFRWLDEKNTIIPNLKNFAIPEMNVVGKPHFQIRQVYDTLDWYTASQIFKLRNRGQGYTNSTALDYPLIGSPDQHHTFHRYSAKFPKNKPELFSMNSNGERITDTRGQICMTNPEARKLMVKILKEFVEADRKKAAKRGVPAPMIYDISANDNPNPCFCTNCRELVKAEGTQSAPLIQFINYIAEEAEKFCPGIQIRTFAYLYSIQPPKTLKPRKNVIIHLAMLGKEFGGHGHADTMRPVNHPNNKQVLEIIHKWSKVASNLAIWDYWKLFGLDSSRCPPYVNIDAIIYNIKYYSKLNISSVFAECETPASTSFFALKRYLGFRLMNNPALDAEKEKADFFKGMYGKAAPVMLEYLNFIISQQEKETAPLGEVPPALREYLDIAYFDHVFNLFDKALALSDNPRIKRNIENELVPVYAGFFLRSKKLDLSKAKRKYDVNKMLDRYIELAAAAVKYYYPEKDVKHVYQKSMKALQEYKKTAFLINNPPPVPEQFKGRRVIDMPYYFFHKFASVDVINDPDSAINGKAIAAGDRVPKKTQNGITNFGIYDMKNKRVLCSAKLASAKLPQDEKYNIIKIGRIKLKHNMIYFYGTNSWVLQCRFTEAFDPAASDKDNTYDVYMSVKFTGPLYVKGSKSPNRIAVNRVMLVN